jgi:hypothetical protein
MARKPVLDTHDESLTENSSGDDLSKMSARSETYPHADLPDRFHEVAVSELGDDQADGAGFVAHTLLDFLWQCPGVPLEKLDADLLGDAAWPSDAA